MDKIFKINNSLIGEEQPPYIIAEACINHEGDINIAKQMIFSAKANNVNCIKFQYHVLDDEMLNEAPQSHNFKETLYDALDRTNFSLEQHNELKTLCESIGIDYLCTPFSRASADILDEELNVSFFKVGSGELTNLPLQKHIAAKGKPMIISTGMSTFEEVKETVDCVKKFDIPFALTHCISAYPAPYEITNLGVIKRYAEAFEIPVGFSDHSVGIYTALGAVAHGACIIEKHFTFDRTAEGPDHLSSIEPYEMGELVKGCNAIHLSKGSERKIFDEEKEIVAWARETVVSTEDIKQGEILTESNISVKRPSPKDGSIPAKHLEEIIGKIAKSDIANNKQIRWDEVE
tara:strand:+ start:2042 stop:3082 length:1041 start_codon:yes stop_codon:yes gene_type:complete